jgi:hypothetical protein
VDTRFVNPSVASASASASASARRVRVRVCVRTSNSLFPSPSASLGTRVLEGRRRVPVSRLPLSALARSLSRSPAPALSHSLSLSLSLSAAVAAAALSCSRRLRSGKRRRGGGAAMERNTGSVKGSGSVRVGGLRSGYVAVVAVAAPAASTFASAVDAAVDAAVDDDVDAAAPLEHTRFLGRALAHVDSPVESVARPFFSLSFTPHDTAPLFALGAFRRPRLAYSTDSRGSLRNSSGRRRAS